MLTKIVYEKIRIWFPNVLINRTQRKIRFILENVYITWLNKLRNVPRIGAKQLILSLEKLFSLLVLQYNII